MSDFFATDPFIAVAVPHWSDTSGIGLGSGLDGRDGALLVLAVVAAVGAAWVRLARPRAAAPDEPAPALP